MKKISFILLLLLTSCALNADQESSLHTAMVSYINSRNNGAVMSYVGYTHPNVVAFYKSAGDSVFKSNFDLSNEEERPFYQDGIIKTIESKGNTIHVKYEFQKIESENYFLDVADIIVIAISEDDGKTWFFIDEKDYMNDKIIPKKDRLL